MSYTSVTSSCEITANANVSMAIVRESLVYLIWHTLERDADERAATGDEFVGERMFDELFERFDIDSEDYAAFTEKFLSLFNSSYEVGSSGTLYIKGDSDSVGGFSPEEAQAVACLVGRVFSEDLIRVSVSIDDSRDGSITHSFDIDNKGLTVDEAPEYKFAA